MMAAMLSPGAQAKSYSGGGGHSYSSSSSHSSSSGSSHSFSSGGGHTFSSGGGSTHSSGSGSGGGHTFSSGGSPAHTSSSSGSSVRPNREPSSGSAQSFSSGGGKSYSSGSTFSESGKHSYTSGKSYSSGTGHAFATSGKTETASTFPKAPAVRTASPDSPRPGFSFDTAAARAGKEEASKQEFTRFKDSQPKPAGARSAPAPSLAGPATAPSVAPRSDSYRAGPPPIRPSDGSSRRTIYIPDTYTYSSRPVRIYNVFNPYAARPVVFYHDSYSSLFWWWLLDRSLDDRAWWAYHHRYDMDPARYQALMQTDQQLEQRVSQLESQQAPRDPNYSPVGLDRDLMYSDERINHVYSNRPTTSGKIAFYALGVPMAFGLAGFFIWLIWFKRWQTA